MVSWVASQAELLASGQAAREVSIACAVAVLSLSIVGRSVLQLMMVMLLLLLLAAGKHQLGPSKFTSLQAASGQARVRAHLYCWSNLV